MATVIERHRLEVEGLVQGVGFRPFVYNLAQRLDLNGFVGNDGRGVFIEVEGPADALDQFRRDLLEQAPPAAVISKLKTRVCKPQGERAFAIVESGSAERPVVLVSPDLDCCDQCLEELFDPADRRFGYPFLNCTQCGPRYTLIEGLPYDRGATTMAFFSLCADCHQEYEDPTNRRFHAQPNACPVCGPSLSEPLSQMVEALRAGEVVGIKGIGGYHLACDAYQRAPLRKLRQRKGRFQKPFAVMVRDLEVARELAVVSPEEAELLASRAKPIVLLRGCGLLPEEVHPGVATLGLMLPYSPLHHLLMAEFEALVMTSANRSGQPMVHRLEQADPDLADRYLHHNRPIAIPVDDSVVRTFRGGVLPVRRSRGYAPFPVELPFEVPEMLAVGGQMKSTVCLGRGGHAFLSQHLGDLENLETWELFEQTLAHLQNLYRHSPELVCADAHPGYLSTQWAQSQRLPLVKVFHHHAHIAAVMAEHQLDPEAEVIGVAFDGTGYGRDQTIWGGEILLASYTQFQRVAHLKPVPLAGGDQAVKEPWRMALAHLWAAGLSWQEELAPVRAAANPALFARQLERSLNSVPTTSVGRLFDAVASLVGLRQQVDYEAQAAIELEALADRDAPGSYPFAPPLDPTPALGALLEDLERDVPPSVISMRFHRGLPEAVVSACQSLAKPLPVALSGGVFANVVLLELVVSGLEENGFHVLTHRLVPPNDGGLALGQLAIGARIAATKGGPLCV